MPIAPNQQPFPGQRKYISVDRQDSTIPKGGTESTWVYPSPQMFYNGVFSTLCSLMICCGGQLFRGILPCAEVPQLDKFILTV